MENIEEMIELMGKDEKKETKSQIIKYLKKWPWFVLFCSLGIFLGYFTYKNSPNTYRVKSRLLVKSDENSMNPIQGFDKQTIASGNGSNIDNQIGIMQSFTLYRKALRKLNWEYSWYEKKLLYNEDLYGNAPFDLTIPPNARNARSIPIEIEPVSDTQYKLRCNGGTNLNGYYETIALEKTLKYGVPFVNEFFNFTLDNVYGKPGTTYLLVFNDLDQLTSSYLGLTRIAVEDANSDIISVTIDSEISPLRAVDFVNELNDVFIEFGVENQYESSENSVKFIDSQLERLKKSVDTAAQNFSNYRRRNQVINLGQEAQLVYSRLEEIEQDQYMTQLQVDYYKDLLQYLDDSKKIEEMASPTVVGISDGNLNDLLKKLTDLYARRQTLSYSVKEKNPSYIMLEKEIKIARDGLEETVRNQMKATELKLQSLEERHSEVQKRLQKLPETEKKMVGIQREFDLNNELYTYMLQKKAEASISKASIAPKVQVIDQALLETTVRTGPNMLKFVAAGIMGGALIPLVFFFLASFFNNTIESMAEVEKTSKLPVLEGILKHKYKTSLPVVQHPRSGIAESFRRVKFNINTIVGEKDSKVITINSLLPGEGKSFISSNLSVILSKSKHKVLLIGADLHNPTLHNYLEIKNTFGLSDYLNNKKGMDEIIFSTKFPDLKIILAGSNQESPSDILDSNKLKQLIERTKKEFDYIIIDNAPLLLVPGSILFSQISDISLFILRMNQSHKSQIDQINKLVSFNKLKHAAILLNDMTGISLGYGYSYYMKYWKKGYKEYNPKMSKG